MKKLFLLFFLFFVISCGSENKDRSERYNCPAKDGDLGLIIKHKEVIMIIGANEIPYKISKENDEIITWKSGKDFFKASNKFFKKTLKWEQDWDEEVLGVDTLVCKR